MNGNRLVLFAILAACTGGDDDGPTDDGHTHPAEPQAFRLRFEATQGGSPVDCTTPLTGVGPSGQHRVGVSDLRFYVSDLRFFDASGAEVEVTLDANDFQYQGADGQVNLIDLTGNTAGDCAGNAISFSEGTARTNDGISGTTLVGDVATITFSVGVPQALMKEVILSNTPEAAPSPLDEMYWSWNTGYRHFVFNSTVSDGVVDGEGYLHVGSTDCSGTGELALETRESCGFVNTPYVEISGFDLDSNVVQVDLGVLIDGLDLVAPVYDPTTFEIIGEQPGISCHSSPSQPHCATIFENLGLDPASGDAAVPAAVFVKG